MIWYLILSIFPVVMMPVVNTIYKSSIKSNEKAKKTFLVLCGFVMFLMLALRSKYVGSNDPLNYYNNWMDMRYFPVENIKEYVHSSEMEIGYLYAVGILSKIFPAPQFLFVLTGAFTVISVCYFIYKNSDDPSISLIMFITLSLYTFMTQAIRQAIAMCICLYAIEYCKKRKFVKFLLLVLLAITFHTSAIFFIPIYFLYGIPLNKISFLLSMLIGGILLVASPQIISLANEWYGSEYYRVVDSGGFVALAIYIIIILLALFYEKQIDDKENFDFIFFMTLFGAIVYSMRYIGGLIAGRASNYYMFGQIILLPNIINSMDKKTGAVIKSVTIILCVLLFAYRLKGSDLIPFEFFWQ